MSSKHVLWSIALYLLMYTPLYAQTHEHKIRAAFWGMKPVEQGAEQLRRLHEHGFNTALVTNQQFDFRTPEWVAWARLAEESHIQLFPVLDFAGTHEIARFANSFRPFVERSGAELRTTPCPTDERYWNRALGERFQQIARLALSMPLAGVVFDTEMYGTDLAVYRDPCLCDVCWKNFMDRAAQNVPELSQDKRWLYLIDHQLLKHYSDLQGEEVQRILTPIEQRVHEINPALELGFLAYIPNWFYRSLIRGLGTVERPLLVFSESTYTQGYTIYLPREMATVKEETQGTHPKPIARYIPGLWLGRFFPISLPMQLHAFAANSDGYWIFSADSLWTPDPMPEPYSLHGSTEQYWSALKIANERIQREPEAVDASQEIGQTPYLSSFYDNALNRLFTQPSLATMLHTLDGKSVSHSQESTPNRIIVPGKTLFHVFNNPYHEGSSIRIRHVPVGPYHNALEYHIFESDGMLFREGRITQAGGSVTIPLPPHISGVVSLLVEAAGNAAEVSFSGLPYLVEASTTFPVHVGTEAQRYSMYVTPEQTSIQLRAFCPEHETALITLQSADGQQNIQIEVNGFTEANIPLAKSPERNPTPSTTLSLLLMEGKMIPFNGKQPTQFAPADKEMWTIHIQPVTSGSESQVECSLFDAEFPYLSKKPLSP